MTWRAISARPYQAAPLNFTPAPASATSSPLKASAPPPSSPGKDYADGGGSRPDPRAGAAAAMAFVPVASQPPASPGVKLINDGHGVVALPGRVGELGDGGGGGGGGGGGDGGGGGRGEDDDHGKAWRALLATSSNALRTLVS